MTQKAFLSRSRQIKIPLPQVPDSIQDPAVREYLYEQNRSIEESLNSLYALESLDGARVIDGTLTVDSIVTGTFISVGGGAADVNAGVTKIEGGKIVTDSITATQIDTGTITVTQMAADSVTDTQLNSSKLDGIESGATQDQTATQIIDATGWEYTTTTKINGAKIQTATITANQIAANTITAAVIKADTITANEIAAGTITATEIDTGTITANEIVARTITTAELTITGSDRIQTENLVTDAVTGNSVTLNVFSSYLVNATWTDIVTTSLTVILAGSLVILRGTVQLDNEAASWRWVSLSMYRDGNLVSGVADVQDMHNGSNYVISFYFVDVSPGAGTYTYKLKGRAEVDNKIIGIGDAILHATEYKR